ncbi:S-type pyocin domain-containing protein [Enterovibrio norvegicus]|uniref:S-type pyocin domain-containing protein n=1 Tax=Enterovibrio norvegicus TaxID=188144 RepID=UPI0024B25450|nr:S-type pyocin domain-containing protein [Enterovibrio norvegicus]
MAKIVRLDSLSNGEAVRIEGSISRYSETDLLAMLPSGSSGVSITSSLARGEMVVVSDNPAAPLFTFSNGKLVANTSNQITMTDQALNDAKQRFLTTKPRMGTSRPANNGPASALSEPTYVPEAVVDDTPGRPILEYEYRFEVACSEETLAAEVGCQFSLGRTSAEGEIGGFEKRPSEHGTEFIARATTDAPRRLITKIAAPEMGVSRRKAVALKPKGKAVVRDAFIPVTPAVQLGARLGFPTEGYYYHFHEHRLAQEYRLLGDGLWGFYATRSTHEALNTKQGFNKYQGAILAFWKIDGKVADNQHLVYLKSPITREQLDNLDEDWLTTHGVKLDIPSLLETKKQTAITRTTNSNSASEHFPPETPNTANHPANVWYDYNDRFLAGSTHKSINKPDSAANDLPVVKLYDDSPQRVFAKSCLVEKGCIDVGTQEEPISNFGPWVLLGGQAHAAVPPPPAAQGAAAGQAVQTNMTMAAGGAGTKTRSANEEAALALTRLAGDLKEAVLSSHHLVAKGISELLLFRPDDMGDNTQYTGDELKDVQFAETRLRLNITHPPGDYYPRVNAYHVNGDQARVPNRYVAELDDGRYSVALGEGEKGPTIYWTPSDSDLPTMTTTPGHDDGFELENILVTPLPEESGATVETFPESQKDWRDAILIFPDSSGIAPLYVVFSVNRGPDGRFTPSNEPKPSLERPSLRAETKRQIEAGARKDANGQFIDKEDNIIEDWQYGHRKGFENRRVLKAADEMGMTQAELNDFMNSRPDYYQIEDEKLNLSHVNEKPGNGELEKIIEHMEEFLDNR